MINISKKDVLWSYAGYVLKFFSGIILLPLLLKFLTPEELGIWYIFIAVNSLVQLLDFGFAPTLTRNVTYAYAGAETILATGISQSGSGINYNLLADIKIVAKMIYRYISIGIILLLGIFGTAYINYVSRCFADNSYILIAWGLYMSTLAINFYFSYWNSLMNGVGLIKEGQKAIITSQILYYVSAILGVACGHGLIALSGAGLFGAILYRYLCKRIWDSNIKLPKFITLKETKKDIFFAVWYNAKKMAYVSVGSFLITQANTFISSICFDLKIVASYGLTIQLVNILKSLSSMHFVTYMPVFSELQTKKSINELIHKVMKSISLATCIYICGAAVMLLWGNYILTLMHSKTLLLPSFLTCFLLICFLLENNHSLFATVITTKNEVPFVAASLLSGVGIVVLSVINTKVFDMGIGGLILAQMVVQLMYNNWYWPMYVIRDWNLTVIEVARIGFQEMYYTISGLLGKLRNS